MDLFFIFMVIYFNCVKSDFEQKTMSLIKRQSHCDIFNYELVYIRSLSAFILLMF